MTLMVLSDVIVVLVGGQQRAYRNADYPLSPAQIIRQNYGRLSMLRPAARFSTAKPSLSSAYDSYTPSTFDTTEPEVIQRAIEYTPSPQIIRPNYGKQPLSRPSLRFSTARPTAPSSFEYNFQTRHTSEPQLIQRTVDYTQG